MLSSKIRTIFRVVTWSLKGPKGTYKYIDRYHCNFCMITVISNVLTNIRPISEGESPCSSKLDV